MPEVDALLGLSFHIYFFDNNQHKLPHVHVKYAEFELIFSIEPINCLDGFLPSKQRKLAETHIKQHQQQFMFMWNKAIKGEHPGKLEDLC